MAHKTEPIYGMILQNNNATFVLFIVHEMKYACLLAFNFHFHLFFQNSRMNFVDMENFYAHWIHTSGKTLNGQMLCIAFMFKYFSSYLCGLVKFIFFCGEMASSILFFNHFRYLRYTFQNIVSILI